MTYNLFWWNLFGQQFQNGNGGSAGKLIQASGVDAPLDFMVFQECEDGNRVLRDAGLEATHAALGIQHAIALAYRKDAWRLEGSDVLVDVAEDQPGLWGRRSLLLARFKHVASGKTVLLANHHGPLVVGSGGICGGKATAWNILRAIAEHAQADDAIVLMGDFNSEASSETVQTLDRYINRHYTGVSFRGVDHIFSSCETMHIKEVKNLGNGGSDHDALAEVLTI